MTSFPIPPNEIERLKELRGLRFDEWREHAPLGELCAIAAKLIGTSIAHISLIDDREQIFAGRVGLDADRTPRAVAFCAHTIMSSKPLIVENTDNDPRFRFSPIVTGGPGIKSYLGIPLETSPGLRIGALCVAERKPRRFDDNDVRTLESLARIVVSVLQSHRMSLELDEQFAGAKALQADMLPSAARMAEIQAHCPLDLWSYYRQRDRVGGDIWGVAVTGPQRLMMYVADFTGHGVPAALNAARFHSFAHMMWPRTGRPEHFLRKLNQRLCEVLPGDQFATMFCAHIDFAMNKMEYACAGAPPQLYRASSEQPFEIISQPSLPLGLLADATYESKALPFFAGGVLVLFTDGLVETPRPPHNLLSANRLRDFLDKADNSKGARQLCEAIVGHLSSDGPASTTDDITLLVAKHTNSVQEDVVDYDV